MVDFRSRLGKKQQDRPTDPVALYDTLDRASDKGPLRPVQRAVLEDWHSNRRSERDVIVKLHTGQGKTLIGLLMLQSRLNEGVGPALYLCPSNFLAAQTASQAKQFGIHCVTTEDEIPAEFLDSKAIFVTSVQKLFNGLTKFGLGIRAQTVGSLLMDDSHACIDAIRQNTTLALPMAHPAYQELLALFGAELEKQGVGSYADIRQKSYNALLPIPYWDWDSKYTDVARIIAKHTATKEVRFVWPIIRDLLRDCYCIVSGQSLEIAPYLPPLHLFASYDKAKYRLFMSATVTNDSFLVKGLGLSTECITKPLTYSEEKWSGEKMILIPSLIDRALTRSAIVEANGPPNANRKSGVVVLAPGFANTADWQRYGAVIARKETLSIDQCVAKLISGKYGDTMVFANRYDGIDLLDDACRVLVLDSLPFSEELTDRYMETCRGDSVISKAKLARIIEQGLGRAVRGEKDYCVIIIIGPELVKMIRSAETAPYFSSQTRAQIDIGLDIAEYAQEDAGKSRKDPVPAEVLGDLQSQCLKRDQDWKDFYVSRMDGIAAGETSANPELLRLYSVEFLAETAFQTGHRDEALRMLQEFLNSDVKDSAEKGWYLQEMARYWYRADKIKSNEMQIAAHRQNRFLLKPREGMELAKISLTQQKRVENVIAWIQRSATHPNLVLVIEAILGNLSFGVSADKFEAAVNELGLSLGFECQRPDKEWKEGPDNLWAVSDDQYILIECKNEVEQNRESINKHETGQMNNAGAWFKRNYPGAKVRRIMIIPTRRVNSAAGFLESVEIMRRPKLERLAKNVRSFFMSFKDVDLQSLSPDTVHAQLQSNGLSAMDLLNQYSEEPQQLTS